MRVSQFTVLENDELCEDCLLKELYQNGRVEVGLDVEPDAKLCEPCGKADHARRREQWSFNQSAANWDELVEASDGNPVGVPVKVLLPNGTVVETTAKLWTSMVDEHGNNMRIALDCSLRIPEIKFLATARDYPLRPKSDETLKPPISAEDLAPGDSRG